MSQETKIWAEIHKLECAYNIIVEVVRGPINQDLLDRINQILPKVKTLKPPYGYTFAWHGGFGMIFNDNPMFMPWPWRKQEDKQ